MGLSIWLCLCLSVQADFLSAYIDKLTHTHAGPNGTISRQQTTTTPTTTTATTTSANNNWLIESLDTTTQNYEHPDSFTPNTISEAEALPSVNTDDKIKTEISTTKPEASLIDSSNITTEKDDFLTVNAIRGIDNASADVENDSSLTSGDEDEIISDASADAETKAENDSSSTSGDDDNAETTPNTSTEHQTHDSLDSYFDYTSKMMRQTEPKTTKNPNKKETVKEEIKDRIDSAFEGEDDEALDGHIMWLLELLGLDETTKAPSTTAAPKNDNNVQWLLDILGVGETAQQPTTTLPSKDNNWLLEKLGLPEEGANSTLTAPSAPHVLDNDDETNENASGWVIGGCIVVTLGFVLCIGYAFISFYSNVFDSCVGAQKSSMVDGVVLGDSEIQCKKFDVEQPESLFLNKDVSIADLITGDAEQLSNTLKQFEESESEKSEDSEPHAQTKHWKKTFRPLSSESTDDSARDKMIERISNKLSEKCSEKIIDGTFSALMRIKAEKKEPVTFEDLSDTFKSKVGMTLEGANQEIDVLLKDLEGEWGFTASLDDILKTHLQKMDGVDIDKFIPNDNYQDFLLKELQ